MMSNNLVKERSYAFALKIIELHRAMMRQNEYILSKQVLRSGTSIGANVEEATAGQSRADFLSKMSIASKEARETNYWLRLIHDSENIAHQDLDWLLTESQSLINIITSIVKTTALNKNNSKLKT